MTEIEAETPEQADREFFKECGWRLSDGIGRITRYEFSNSTDIDFSEQLKREEQERRKVRLQYETLKNRFEPGENK